MSINARQIGGDSDVTYLSVIGGKMMQKVNEDTPGAMKRVYETSDGWEGTKWEIAFADLTGRIINLEFVDGKFGEQFYITMKSGETTVKVSFNTDSKYFTSFARCLPNIDLNKDITINTYDFESEGKKYTGVSVKQEWDKIKDYYFDGKKSLHGMPEVSATDRKGYTKDDWKIFFLGVKKFLKAEVLKVEIPAYVAENKVEETKTVNKEEEISVDDIPFR